LEPGRISLDGQTPLLVTVGFEPEIIRMDIEQRHATAFSDPIEFPGPDRFVRFFEEEEEGRVLGEGVGEFDVAGAGGWRRRGR